MGGLIAGQTGMLCLEHEGAGETQKDKTDAEYLGAIVRSCSNRCQIGKLAHGSALRSLRLGGLVVTQAQFPAPAP